MRAIVAASITACAVVLAGAVAAPPSLQISNGLVTATVYLPDATAGFYRGTRFDWAGVVGRLEYRGHTYYGPWFTKTDPAVRDFVYDGTDIVAGPNSAITGPVEEFSTDGQALGMRRRRRAGTFIKIGVGVLRKPADGAPVQPVSSLRHRGWREAERCKFGRLGRVLPGRERSVERLWLYLYERRCAW